MFSQHPWFGQKTSQDTCLSTQAQKHVIHFSHAGLAQLNIGGSGNGVYPLCEWLEDLIGKGETWGLGPLQLKHSNPHFSLPRRVQGYRKGHVRPLEARPLDSQEYKIHGLEGKPRKKKHGSVA